MAVVVLFLVSCWILILYAQPNTVTLLPQEHQNVCRGESISYNCIGSGTVMVLFSPPIVNESNPISLLSSNAVQTCNVIINSAAAIVLVDSTGSTSFMGTFILYISDEQSEGQRTVFCRVIAADGIVTTKETTFSVLGAASPVISLNFQVSSEDVIQVPVNVSWDSPDNAEEFMLQIKSTDYNNTIRSLENSVTVLLPPGTYSATLCAINRCGKTCRDYPNIFSAQSSVAIDCGRPSISSDGGVVIEPFANTMFNATIIFHCEEGLVPDTVIEAVCGSTGVWSPNPANHMCVNESLAFCSSAPAVPIGAHISDQSTGLYPEGTNITIQCDDVPQATLTTVCHADGSWRPLPSELDCTTATSESATVTVTADIKKVLSSSSQTILATVICSFVFFFFGVLVGVLCHRWGRVFIKPYTSDIKHSNGKRREHPSPTDTPAGDGPVVYEEVTTDSHSRQKIELEENVAYGHI